MSNDNKLIQLRRALKIPETVTIVAGEKFNVLQSRIGNQPSSSKYNIPQGAIKDTPLQVLIYTSVHLKVPEYTDNMGRTIPVLEQSYESILMRISQSKIIVTTKIQGRDGSVKEYIGMDDYTVEINGVITAANGNSPASDVATLKKILDAPVPIEVSSGYLQNLGIYSIVTFDYNLAQEAGSYSYQPFTTVFKSDIPQELRISGI